MELNRAHTSSEALQPSYLSLSNNNVKKLDKKRLSRRYPDPSVIVLSVQDSIEYCYSAISLGRHGSHCDTEILLVDVA